MTLNFISAVLNLLEPFNVRTYIPSRLRWETGQWLPVEQAAKAPVGVMNNDLALAA
ncbi:MAG: hypothetical protein ACTH4Y_07410 [Microbacterium gubbeenense]|uniref:hypothetical protein n=1 Tax=Microbacterium gubbeenense TaxID=159896 RepID=UPI003F9B8C9A